MKPWMWSSLRVFGVVVMVWFLTVMFLGALHLLAGRALSAPRATEQVATPTAFPEPQGTVIQVRPFPCPEGVLVAEFRDTDGDPGNGFEEARLSVDGVEVAVLLYGRGLDGRLEALWVREGGGVVKYPDAEKYPTVCSFMGLKA